MYIDRPVSQWNRGVAESFAKGIGIVNYSIYCPAERCLHREISIPPTPTKAVLAQNQI